MYPRDGNHVKNLYHQYCHGPWDRLLLWWYQRGQWGWRATSEGVSRPGWRAWDWILSGWKPLEAFEQRRDLIRLRFWKRLRCYSLWPFPASLALTGPRRAAAPSPYSPCPLIFLTLQWVAHQLPKWCSVPRSIPAKSVTQYFFYLIFCLLHFFFSIRAHPSLQRFSVLEQFWMTSFRKVRCDKFIHTLLPETTHFTC